MSVMQEAQGQGISILKECEDWEADLLMMPSVMRNSPARLA